MRYVVLKHVGGEDGDHYDLLVERQAGSGDLQTWRVPEWPIEGAHDAKGLKDHRRVYLTYQGEVTGGRGWVARVAEGEAMVTRFGGEGVQVQFEDGRVIELTEESEGRWVVRGR